LGGVLGDAFGVPLEGAAQSGMAALIERRVKSRVHWGYSDDGAMLIAVAEALLSARTIDPVILFEHFVRRYEPARGFGRGMKIAISAFTSGVHWDRCAFAAWPEGSRGNGGAVRMAPIAATSWTTSEAFYRAVHIATRVTHAHADALAFARVQACAIAVVLQAPSVLNDTTAFEAALVSRLDAMPDSVAAHLETVFDLVRRGATPTEAAATLGTSTLALESVPAALWAFVSQHSTFSNAISQAALLGGDVDSICSMVGALAGALHGASAIDSAWTANLALEQPSPEALLNLADGLFALEPTSPLVG
jgi:poly(ADP-ribose) glycohydrolase ARH3